MIARNESIKGTSYDYVEVPAVRFEDVLAQYGTPTFLKVDIEGLDMLCVRALHNVRARPRYGFVGMGGRFSRTLPAKVYRRARLHWLQRPLAWYDLHAAWPT